LRRSGRLFIAACALASALAVAASAQISSRAQPRPPAHAKHYMVAAAHPLAVEAGLRMLDKGGNAIDAAIATQLVLNLVEPHASGLGGGAFLLFYDARRNAIRAYDGRETAPEAVTPALFTGPDGKPMAFNDAVIGGRSVGVPGVPRLLELAHARHGRLAWATLFQPAIDLAEKGFALPARVHALLENDHGLVRDAAAKEYFYTTDGKPKPAGTVLRNPEFARTLRALAARGAEAFYSGDIALDIVAAVRGHPFNPGVMTEHDLAAYRVREVEALCAPYRAYRVCGMPPSSSGGIAVLQILGMLSRFDMASVRPGSTEAVHLVAEAGRLAFADRNRYVADDRFAEVPIKGLIDPAYLAERSKLIQEHKSMGKAEAGVPQGIKVAYADDPVDEMAGTSHIAVVDKDGNAVSMTTTIETNFGSHVMVRGFLLNNQLTDFNFLPVEDGVRVANGVYPGKRPRSSMAPTLVFDNWDKLYMAVGSPGGPFIIGYVVKTLIATLDWKMDMQSAIDLPNFGSRNGPTEIEKGSNYEKLIGPLRALGHDVHIIDMASGVQGIVRVRDGWQGGADRRREGIAKGR
jgi:gamma-glutamyltranspeptidase/glutathione hydrolase